MDDEKRKIIVAEDSLELCEILGLVLREEGFEVDFVHNGYELIAYLKENQDVDAIILDLIMPEKNGTTVFETIRTIAPASKIIIYTGYSQFRDSIYGRKADAFLDKTVSTEKIIETLRELLDYPAQKTDNDA